MRPTTRTDEQRTERDQTRDKKSTSDTWKRGKRTARRKGGVNGAGFEGGGTDGRTEGGFRFYLRKRAASEEAEQPETLTGDSYTDLRRDRTGEQQGGTGTKQNGQEEEQGGVKKDSQTEEEEEEVKIEDRHRSRSAEKQQEEKKFGGKRSKTKWNNVTNRSI